METKQLEKNSVEDLKDLVVMNLIDFFSGDEKRNEDRVTEAKMAMGTLGGVSRLIATERVRDATQFSIIRTITTSEEERARYIQATMPGYMPNLLKGK